MQNHMMKRKRMEQWNRILNLDDNKNVYQAQLDQLVPETIISYTSLQAFITTNP